MSELFDLQSDFAASLRSPAASRCSAQWLRGDALLIERRLGIYRANVAAAASKALGAAYPVVQQLVGEEFFGGLSREYLRAFPSTSGDLFDFGQEFAGFLHNFPHTQSLAYLPDLARLEWRVHRAHGALDASPFDFSALSQVPADQQGSILFQWAAGTALLVSRYPIVQLWQIHRQGFDGHFGVDWSHGEFACVAREGFEVVVSAMAAADAAFIDSSLAGASLGLACEAAIAVDAAFDPGALLARAVAARLITGFVVPTPESTT